LAMAKARRLCHGLDAGGRRPASHAVVSTSAAEIRRGDPPPSPWSRRRRLKTACLAGFPCRGLDAGGRDPLQCPRSRRQRAGAAALSALFKRSFEKGQCGLVVWAHY